MELIIRLNIKPPYLYAALHDEDNAVTEGNATTPSACAHSGGCLTIKEGPVYDATVKHVVSGGLRSMGYLVWVSCYCYFEWWYIFDWECLEAVVWYVFMSFGSEWVTEDMRYARVFVVYVLVWVHLGSLCKCVRIGY